jgi:predicted nucleotidyltransferase
VIRPRVVAELRKLAASLGSAAHGTEWHLFGSVDRDESDAADIDLMIFCRSAAQADVLRQAIDPNSLELPIHLSLMTFDEAAKVDAVRVQCSTAIVP